MFLLLKIFYFRKSNSQKSLPTFSGKLQEWIEFGGLYSPTVHKNNNLTNAQILQYLKRSCKSEALSTIQSILISDKNYDIAWKC